MKDLLGMLLKSVYNQNMRCMGCGKEMGIDSAFCHCQECMACMDEENEENSKKKPYTKLPHEGVFLEFIITIIGVVCGFFAIVYVLTFNGHTDSYGWAIILYFSLLPITFISLLNVLLAIISIRMNGLKGIHILSLLFSLSMLIIGLSLIPRFK